MTDHVQEFTDTVGVVKGVDDPVEAARLAAIPVDEDGYDVYTDEYLASIETKGPDIAEWGDDAERPDPQGATAIDHTDEEGNPMEVKGPDPEVWGDA